jgi:predicted phosphodiesterase
MIALPNPDYKVFAWDYDKYESRILPKKYDWVTIGDVHGCINELKELLVKYGFEIDGHTLVDTDKSKNVGLIFVGDLVDKSSEQELEETIRFIHNNMNIFGDRFHMVMGNHEEMVWKWITNDKSLEITPERLDQKSRYYNTTFLLEKNVELKDMFLEIYGNMKGWVKTIGTEKRSFVVTHAPCEVNVLEKMDGKSLRKQYKCASRSKNRDKTNDEITPYLKEEAVNNHPVHIFGHMGQTSVRTFKNKVCIDTGCVYGHKLVGYSVNGSKPFIQSVSAMGEKTGRNDFSNDLFADAKAESKNVRIEDLSETNQKRLDYIIENGIGYIGGTISPSDKDEETGKLESLKAGLDYYKGKVDSVVLQPKYMGSRAQMYLNRDIEKCYATSRNGYKIRQDLTDVFKDQLDCQATIMYNYGLQELVLDGELMPWAAMGEGLIDKQFRVIDEAIKSEIDFLAENGFDDSFGLLVDEWSRSDFDSVKSTMSKKDLQDKFGHAYNNYKYVKSELDRWQTIDKHQSAWETYHKQVEIYGNPDGVIHYKPFRILKGIDADGNIVKIDLNTVEQFQSINSDEIHIVNFSDTNYQELSDMWYEKITMIENMEGCVIKPVNTDFHHYIAPFMKVRNRDYLSIIYGYDMYFPQKYNKLFTQKNINKKVKSSIQEWKLGEEMIQYGDNIEGFKQIVANLMFENEKEGNIDPRL